MIISLSGRKDLMSSYGRHGYSTRCLCQTCENRKIFYPRDLFLVFLSSFLFSAIFSIINPAQRMVKSNPTVTPRFPRIRILAIHTVRTSPHNAISSIIQHLLNHGKRVYIRSELYVNFRNHNHEFLRKGRTS